VTNIERLDDNIKVATTDGDRYARAVLMPPAAEYKKLGIPGEDTYYARGVHYCATCDGAFYRNKKLVVVGRWQFGCPRIIIFNPFFASHIDLLVRSKLKPVMSYSTN